MLKGEAKRDYMRTYMREYMQRRRAGARPLESDKRGHPELVARIVELEGQLSRQNGRAAAPGWTNVALTADWRKPLADAAAAFGVPEGELASFMLIHGWNWFYRVIAPRQRMKRDADGNEIVSMVDMPNDLVLWLIEMSEKYPDTFDRGAWEGSCTHRSLDKLKAEQGIRVDAPASCAVAPPDNARKAKARRER
jgi:hypothetical protein